MILAFIEARDYSSKQVLEWLVNSNEQFEVFTEKDILEIEYFFSNNDVDFHVFKNGNLICSGTQIKSVFIRRLYPSFKQLKNNSYYLEDNYNKGHFLTRKDMAYYLLEAKRSIGCFEKGNFNKLEFLKKCVDLGIDIPNTLVTTKKDQLIEFISENGEVVCKSISATYSSLSEDKKTYRDSYTTLLHEEDIQSIPDTFELSLFQQKLDKKYEVRVFYVNGTCFSQVIFSQNNKESSIDFRKGYGSAMRQCPFILPEMVEVQVKKLMSYLNLSTGSIDIVVTTANTYVFLEVNPAGQFGNVSIVSNYNLEREIANYLINE